MDLGALSFGFGLSSHVKTEIEKGENIAILGKRGKIRSHVRDVRFLWKSHTCSVTCDALTTVVQVKTKTTSFASNEADAQVKVGSSVQ